MQGAQTEMQRERDTFSENLPEMAHLVMENEKLRRKVKKAQQRRDHYARLYYRILTQFDETKWELTVARNKIQELKAQVANSQHPVPTTSATSTPPHSLPPSSSSSTHPHHMAPNSTTSTVSEGSDSNTNVTSPDSGASLSPIIEPFNEGVAPPPPFLRAKTLPRMSRGSAGYSYNMPPGHIHGYIPPNEAWNGMGMDSRKLEQMEMWNMDPGVRGMETRNHQHLQLQHRVQRVAQEFAREHSQESDNDLRSPHVSRKLPKPPREAFASSNLRRQFHPPNFPPSHHPALDAPCSCSQGDSSSQASPLLTAHRKPVAEVLAPSSHYQQDCSPVPAYTLSQEAYVSSPPSVRRPAFQRPRTLSASHSQGTILPPSAHICHSALPSFFTHPRAQPVFERSCLSQDDGVSYPVAPHPSAFKKPSVLPRRISHSSPQAPPLQQQLLSPSNPNPSNGHPLQVNLVESSSLSSSGGDPSPSGFSAGSSATTGSSSSGGVESLDRQHSDGKGVRMVGERGIERETEQRRRDEEEGEGEECRLKNLSGVQLLDLLARISDPKCAITKLEVSASQLGQPEAMRLFCKDLLRNRSITELSLPGNGINEASLDTLLECIKRCDNIKELMLRNNRIGRECADIVKAFLTQTDLDSLVLTGNEIEQYGHLLNGALPSDFTMEYDGTEGSEDSGLVVADSDHSYGNSTAACEQSLNTFKYLHL